MPKGMLRFGIAGNPLSCKSRTVVGGLINLSLLMEKYTKLLPAMEIEIIHTTDIGNTEEIKNTAKKYNIKLSLHAPYYMQFTKSKKKQIYIEKLKNCLVLADKIGASPVITHLGFYMSNKSKTLEYIINDIQQLQKYITRKKLNVQLAIEPSGRKAVFGTYEEILDVCKRVPGVIPIINIPHIYARKNGNLKTDKDFEELFNVAKKIIHKNNFYINIAGAIYKDSDEICLTNLKKSDLKYDLFIKTLVENKISGSVITSSPLGEYDAINLYLTYEKYMSKS